MQAINVIPKVKVFKAGKKFNVVGGGDKEDDEAHIIESDNDSDIENNMNESQLVIVKESA